MQFQFKLIPSDSIQVVVPLVKRMSKASVTEDLLLERFREMVTQNIGEISNQINKINKTL